MTDLELFLDRCLVVEETMVGGSYAVFLRIPEPYDETVEGDENDWAHFHACRILDIIPREMDTDGEVYEAFPIFGDESSGTREEAEACLKMMKICIRRLVNHKAVAPSPTMEAIL